MAVIRQRETWALPPRRILGSKTGIHLLPIFDHHMVKKHGGFSVYAWKDALNEKEWYCLNDIPVMEKFNDVTPIEAVAKEYLKEVTSRLGFNLEYGGVNENPTGIDHLSPLFASLDKGPDAFAQRKITESCTLPIMYIEVHSGNTTASYENTLAKLLIEVIDQVRLLGNYQSTFSECIGFVFPNMEEPSFAAKLTLKWTESFLFEYMFCALKKEVVKKEIKSAVGAIYSKLSSSLDVDAGMRYFIRLSEQSLLQVGEGLIQVPSKYNIVLCDQDYYYKMFPDVKAELTCNIMKCRSCGLSCDQLSISCFVKPFGIVCFYGFEKLPYQISRDQAKQCLYQFVVEVNDALDVLHNHFAFAHLDIKLDNICFNKNFKPVLIDFDRAMPVDYSADALPGLYPNGIMYSKPELAEDMWEYKHADFKQLGECISS